MQRRMLISNVSSSLLMSVLHGFFMPLDFASIAKVSCDRSKPNRAVYLGSQKVNIYQPALASMNDYYHRNNILLLKCAQKWRVPLS